MFYVFEFDFIPLKLTFPNNVKRRSLHLLIVCISNPIPQCSSGSTSYRDLRTRHPGLPGYPKRRRSRLLFVGPHPLPSCPAPSSHRWSRIIDCRARRRRPRPRDPITGCRRNRNLCGGSRRNKQANQYRETKVSGVLVVLAVMGL